MQRGQIYKCNICGNIVELIHLGGGQLVCCGQPMELLKEKNQEEGQEKHLPVVEEKDGLVKIRVGEVPHPMEENHYIEWIELITDNKSYFRFLKPGDSPEAEFLVNENPLKARVYCNIHGLWSK